MWLFSDLLPMIKVWISYLYTQLSTKTPLPKVTFRQWVVASIVSNVDMTAAIWDDDGRTFSACRCDSLCYYGNHRYPLKVNTAANFTGI